MATDIKIGPTRGMFNHNYVISNIEKVMTVGVKVLPKCSDRRCFFYNPLSAHQHYTNENKLTCRFRIRIRIIGYVRARYLRTFHFAMASEVGFDSAWAASSSWYTLSSHSEDAKGPSPFFLCCSVKRDYESMKRLSRITEAQKGQWKFKFTEGSCRIPLSQKDSGHIIMYTE